MIDVATGMQTVIPVFDRFISSRSPLDCRLQTIRGPKAVANAGRRRRTPHVAHASYLDSSLRARASLVPANRRET